MSIFDVAMAYLLTGLSVIPIRLGRSKTPAVRSWKPYQYRHGWRFPYDFDGIQYWKRTKKKGASVSASVNQAGLNLLYNFSTNAAALQPYRSDTLFTCLALL